MEVEHCHIHLLHGQVVPLPCGFVQPRSHLYFHVMSETWSETWILPTHPGARAFRHRAFGPRQDRDFKLPGHVAKERRFAKDLRAIGVLCRRLQEMLKEVICLNSSVRKSWGVSQFHPVIDVHTLEVSHRC